jgi:prevent-host-death family protein
MRRTRASGFKARCLAVMRGVQATGEPVIVTKRGIPFVKIVPVEPEKNNLCGFMAGEFKIVGDLEAPVVPVKRWNVVRE